MGNILLLSDKTAFQHSTELCLLYPQKHKMFNINNPSPTSLTIFQKINKSRARKYATQ